MIPPRWAFRLFWGFDKLLDRVTGGRVDTKRSMGISRLFLTTTGRRSGKPREVGVFFVRDGTGFAVVPSNAGEDRDPAWWLNLQARPEGSVRVGRDGPRPVRAREATAEEEAVLWPQFVKANADYETYRAKAARRIPVVILESAGSAPPKNARRPTGRVHCLEVNTRRSVGHRIG